MPISAMLVETLPGQESIVAERLVRCPGLRVHDSAPGRLVVTTDTFRMEDDRALTDTVTRVEGVLAGHVVLCFDEEMITVEDEA